MNNLLPEKLREEIDKWTIKYPSERRQSAVLPALLTAQDYNGGWLSQELIDSVADYLNMSRVTAYEVATFYTMYDREPTGRHKISICTNVSCMLSGCDKIVKHLKQRLGVGFNEVTTDGKFVLKEVECLGACANAPVIHLGKRYHENLTPEKIDQILDGLE